MGLTDTLMLVALAMADPCVSEVCRNYNSLIFETSTCGSLRSGWERTLNKMILPEIWRRNKASLYNLTWSWWHAIDSSSEEGESDLCACARTDPISEDIQFFLTKACSSMLYIQIFPTLMPFQCNEMEERDLWDFQLKWKCNNAWQLAGREHGRGQRLDQKCDAGRRWQLSHLGQSPFSHFSTGFLPWWQLRIWPILAKMLVLGQHLTLPLEQDSNTSSWTPTGRGTIGDPGVRSGVNSR